MKKTKKLNPKAKIADIIKDWKGEKSNKEYLKNINIEFIPNFFKTLLINYPKDSTWIHSVDNEKFSSISHARVEAFNTGEVKYKELVSMNVIDPNDGEEDWDESDENNPESFDVLNIVVDCEHVLSADELRVIKSKYKTMALLIRKQFKPDISLKYGEEFKDYLFNFVLKDHLLTEKPLQIIISFINISDDNINLENFADDSETSEISDSQICCKFYNYDRLYHLFDQCKQCQWPYVNATETLKLTSKEVCVYKAPDKPLKGFMCNVSAKSLAELYDKYKYGLFSGNIRYFIKRGKGAKKVNDGLEQSIVQKDLRSLFYFKNNGITFISPKVKINGKNVDLSMFSIVNGGQTTYKIGTENFDTDFTVPCKILEIKIDISDKLKKKNLEKYNKNLLEWLKYAGEISEALNSQKPVSDKDLITNKPVVRNLKHYYNANSNDIYLLTKAGEETFLSIEKEKLIKLETFLTIVYCFYLQQPGYAKNKKAQMYKPAPIARVLGDDESGECKKYFSPSQLAEVNIAKKYIDKTINRIALEAKKNPELYQDEDDQTIIRLLRNCKNIVLSLFGLVRMNSFNLRMFDEYKETNYFKDHFARKYNNYIDLYTSIFIAENLNNKNIWKEAIWEIGKLILLPSYKRWQKDYKNLDIRNMTLADETYFTYIVSTFKEMFKDNKKQWQRIFIDLMPLSVGE